MNIEGLSGLVSRIIAWADGLQRRHGVLGLPYAVVKKYGDDEGGRQAALITYCRAGVVCSSASRRWSGALPVHWRVVAGVPIGPSGVLVT